MPMQLTGSSVSEVNAMNSWHGSPCSVPRGEMFKPSVSHQQGEALKVRAPEPPGNGGLSPDSKQRCSCGTGLDYSHPYDAEFCPACDRWWAKSCRDPTCEFCAKRPDRPSLAAAPERTPRAPFNAPKVRPVRQRKRS